MAQYPCGVQIDSLKYSFGIVLRYSVELPINVQKLDDTLRDISNKLLFRVDSVDSEVNVRGDG